MDVEQTETFTPGVETFAAALLRHGASLPLTVSTTDVGDVLDATGRVILTVDQHGERPDADVDGITVLIVMAANIAAGHLVQAVR